MLYPSAIGIGGQRLANEVHDPVLRRLCVEIYNDAMAELQEWSGNRFLPMPVLPAWSIDECVNEAQRLAGLGFRGVNMTSDPEETGSPDFADHAWDALWEVCADLKLPVHFHIGASLTSLNFYGQYFWASQHENVLRLPCSVLCALPSVPSVLQIPALQLLTPNGKRPTHTSGATSASRTNPRDRNNLPRA